MEEQIELKLAITLLEDVRFSESQLIRIGVVFLEKLDDIKSAAESLGVYLENESELVNHGLTLTQIGTISNPKWTLHEIHLDSKHINSIWKGENFYNIDLLEEDRVTSLFKQVYLRENHFDEDIQYYADLHVESFSNFPVFTDYIQ